MLEVKEPGLFTTVQDLGRNGYQAYGMPVAGAMDEYACKMANRLLGNEPGAAVLDMTLLGGSFFFRQACWVAVTGAAMPIPPRLISLTVAWAHSRSPNPSGASDNPKSDTRNVDGNPGRMVGAPRTFYVQGRYAF